MTNCLVSCVEQATQEDSAYPTTGKMTYPAAMLILCLNDPLALALDNIFIILILHLALFVPFFTV